MTWKKLNTLGHKKKEFRYGGSVDQNVVLDQSGQPRIDATFFNAALKHFSGKTISGGFSQDNPLVGGFGEWVRDQSPRHNCRQLSPRHGSFMAAILCAEKGVKSWLEGNSIKLKFPVA